MMVDPAGQNYFTARFSGDEVNENRLTLFADGKQIGWRHLGEVDPLDVGTYQPAVPGRFYYNTLPLPRSLTRGKTEVRFEVRSGGLLWGYGTTFDKYQKPMTTPSRGLYRVYTHTDGYFVPPTDERQGAAPADPPVRAAPGPEVLDRIKDRVNGELDARLDPKVTPSQMQAALLAKAYDVAWSHAYHNPKAVDQIVKGLDTLFAAYRKDPKLADEEPGTWNPEWFGLGVCGQIISLRQHELAAHFDETIDDGQGGTIGRRAAYTEMLVACRDWHRLNRRQYTNQTMLNDLNGIYFANRGVAVLSPDRAMPETAVRRYLYESVGLQPWRDSDPGGKLWNVGPDYLQLTDKGLTKELGYVGTYGEVIDLVADIYNATRPTPAEPGDERIRAQLVKIAVARAAMRYPALDGDGNRTMRLEQVVGWRDAHYPGEVTYGQRATRDASALQAAAITLDPKLVGYAQQLIEDNQFFESEAHAMEDRAQPLRTTIGRLETPGQYELIRKQPRSPDRLPMSGGNDYVFSDEEDGVVAVRHGDSILYASLYWRARFGVNDLARVHLITPWGERIAVVAEKTRFRPSGQTFTWKNWTNMAFGNGGLKYPGEEIQSAYAGQTQPIAQFPPGVPPAKPGDESPYAGRGDFYELRYGPYLIGLNMSRDRSFELKVPDDAPAAIDLTANRAAVAAGAARPVGPRTTAVIYLGDR